MNGLEGIEDFEDYEEYIKIKEDGVTKKDKDKIKHILKDIPLRPLEFYKDR